MPPKPPPDCDREVHSYAKPDKLRSVSSTPSVRLRTTGVGQNHNLPQTSLSYIDKLWPLCVHHYKQSPLRLINVTASFKLFVQRATPIFGRVVSAYQHLQPLCTLILNVPARMILEHAAPEPETAIATFATISPHTHEPEEILRRFGRPHSTCRTSSATDNRHGPTA